MIPVVHRENADSLSTVISTVFLLLIRRTSIFFAVKTSSNLRIYEILVSSFDHRSDHLLTPESCCRSSAMGSIASRVALLGERLDRADDPAAAVWEKCMFVLKLRE